MAILWQDGFDLYNNATDMQMNYVVAGGGNLSTNGGRFGGGTWRAQGNVSGVAQNVGSQTNVWSSFAFNIWAANSNDAVVCTWASTVGASAGIEAMLTYNRASGTWHIWRGYFQTLLETVTYPVTSNAWHWLDARLKWDASTGSFEFWIDDVQVGSYTGLNTVQNSGGSLVTATLGDIAGNATIDAYMDDWFIYDAGTTRLGDSRIETTLMASDVGPNQGTPSSGSNHYAVVNEAQWNTSNYITMPNTSGDKEVFSTASIVSTPASVWNVKIYMVSDKSDAGSYQLEPLVISSGTEADGSAQQLTTSWGVQSAMFPHDPFTSAPWTYAAVNAMDVGFKVP